MRRIVSRSNGAIEYYSRSASGSNGGSHFSYRTRIVCAVLSAYVTTTMTGRTLTMTACGGNFRSECSAKRHLITATRSHGAWT